MKTNKETTYTILFYNASGYSRYCLKCSSVKNSNKLIRRLQKIYDKHNSPNDLIQFSEILKYLSKKENAYLVEHNIGDLTKSSFEYQKDTIVINDWISTVYSFDIIPESVRAQMGLPKGVEYTEEKQWRPLNVNAT